MSRSPQQRTSPTLADVAIKLMPIDLKGGGCDGPMPMWQLLSIEGPGDLLQGIGHMGHLVPWLPNDLQPVGNRWIFPLPYKEMRPPKAGFSLRGWGTVKLFDKYALVKRRGHVLYIKGTLVKAVFWRVG